MKSILIVEDETDIAAVLEELFCMEGYSVITVSNGEQALDILKKRQPDVILSDIMMPFMNGKEMLKAIRKNKDLKEMPVILMSAAQLMPDPDTPQFFAFIKKPPNLDYLLDVVRSALEPMETR